MFLKLINLKVASLVQNNFFKKLTQYVTELGLNVILIFNSYMFLLFE